jgi:hypothetical protein
LLNLLLNQLQLVFGLDTIKSPHEIVHLGFQSLELNLHVFILQEGLKHFKVLLVGRFELVDVDFAPFFPAFSYLRREYDKTKFSFEYLSTHL